jgi:hypothetical protein
MRKVINWSISKEDHEVVRKVVKRAIKSGAVSSGMDFEMDLTAAHLNGCPIDLKKLLEAPDADFLHDVYGIKRHINRTTGELEDCFLPRSARPALSEVAQ